MHLGARFPVVFWSQRCQRTQVQPTGVGGSPGKVLGEGGTNASEVSPKRAEPSGWPGADWFNVPCALLGGRPLAKVNCLSWLSRCVETQGGKRVPRHPSAVHLI